MVWLGAGSVGARDGRVRLCFADQIGLLAGGWERPEPPAGRVHEAIRELLRPARRGVLGAAARRRPGRHRDRGAGALWDLVWAGEVTNDSLAPVRAMLGGAATGGTAIGAHRLGAPAPGPDADAARSPRRRRALEPRRTAAEPTPTPTEAAHAQALQLLERYGVVTREAVLAEGVTGGFASVYGVLKVLEERGRARRGYFVAGLGAAQFAVPGAVDRLRSARDPEQDDPLVVLAATDPAQPYGASLAWPERTGGDGGRPARTASSIVILSGGEPLAWFDRSSHHLVTFPATAADDRWARALAERVAGGYERSLEVRKVDGGAIRRRSATRCGRSASSTAIAAWSCAPPPRCGVRPF